MAMDCCRQRLVVLRPSIIDAGLSSSVLGEEHRTLNPVPPAFQWPDSITVRLLHGRSCAQPCARRPPSSPPVAAGWRRRPRIEGSHVGPKKSAQAATGFTRQAVGIWLGGSLDCRYRGDGRELTTSRRAGWTSKVMGMNWQRPPPVETRQDPSSPPELSDKSPASKCWGSDTVGTSRASSHSVSDRVRSLRFWRASTMKSAENPSQLLGSPYIPFTGGRGGYFLWNSSDELALFLVLHL